MIKVDLLSKLSYVPQYVLEYIISNGLLVTSLLGKHIFPNDLGM